MDRGDCGICCAKEPPLDFSTKKREEEKGKTTKNVMTISEAVMGVGWGFRQSCLLSSLLHLSDKRKRAASYN